MGITLHNVHLDGLVGAPLLNKPQVAILDSGTSLSYFSKDIVDSMHNYLNANPSFQIGQKYYCDCNVTGNFVLDFGGGHQIKIPNYNVLWPIEQFVGTTRANLFFPENSCYIGIEEINQGFDFILLGDNFLRAMYVGYDITNNNIALAQVNPHPTQSQIEAITNRIPGALYI